MREEDVGARLAGDDDVGVIIDSHLQIGNFISRISGRGDADEQQREQIDRSHAKAMPGIPAAGKRR
jgi:hypothetical protein